MSEHDDDRRWVEAIAGRPGGADDAADREAAAVREALLAARAGDAMSARESEQGLDRLLERLRRERLLGEERAGPPRRWMAWAAATATLLVVAGVVLWPQLQQPEPDEIVVRGAPPQELVDARPAERAARLAAELEALGLTVVRRETRGGLLLEALIEKRDDPRLAEALARQGLRVPQSGPLLVRITEGKR